MRAILRTLLAAALACFGNSPSVAQAAPEPTSAAIRVGLRARNGGADRLTSLRYVGGFESKTMLLETLVRRGPDGRLVPGLAGRWEIRDEGRTFLFELRDGARFHDGTPVTAESVVTHYRRWANLPEHNWLPGNQRITRIEADDARSFRIELDRPYALLEDLLAINPCAVVAPSSKDWEGEFLRPIGTGPFRFVGAFDGGRRWRVQGTQEDGPLVDVTFYPRGRDSTPIHDLLAGRIDAFVGGWDEDLPGEELDRLAADPEYRVQTAPGSSLVYLSFRLVDGPTADLAVRRKIAAALDRSSLIATVEGDRAEAATAWAAPSVAFWPRGRSGIPSDATANASDAPLPRLTIAAGRPESRAARAAHAVADQLRVAGFAVEVLEPPAAPAESPTTVVDAHGAVTPLTTESGEVRAALGRRVRAVSDRADLRIEITHGMPYCPHQSLVTRFGTTRDGQSPRGTPDELRSLVDQAAAEPDETLRIPIYAHIQSLMDREAIVVPLYVPWRVAIARSDIQGISLGPDVYHADLTGLRRLDASKQR